MEHEALQKAMQQTVVLVHQEPYAFMRTETVVAGDHLMVSADQDEITMITKESNTHSVRAGGTVVRGFVLVEISATDVMTAPGFLGMLVTTMEQAGANVSVVSTFSKYYFLLSREASEKVLVAIENLGCTIKILE